MDTFTTIRDYFLDHKTDKNLLIVSFGVTSAPCATKGVADVDKPEFIAVNVVSSSRAIETLRFFAEAETMRQSR